MKIRKTLAERKANPVRRRRLFCELLEPRRLLNVEWRNPADSLDVDADRKISPLDVLTVVNEINRRTDRILPPARPNGAAFFDVDGDGGITPLDVLSLVNAINAGVQSPRSLTEGSSFANEQSIIVTTGQTHGSRKVQLEINAIWDPVASGSMLQDRLNVYVTRPRESNTLIDRGTQGTSIFSLSTDRAETAPGISTWDGRILTVDLTGVTGTDTAEIRLQLLSQLASSGTRIDVLPASNEVDPNLVANAFSLSSEAVVPFGSSVNVTSWNPLASIEILTENWRYDSVSGTTKLDVRLLNRGPTIGRNAALLLSGLPSGVGVRNASGQTSAGVPYWNLTSAIARGGLGTNVRSALFSIELAVPSNMRFPITGSVISAGPNRPPILAPMSPINIMPGGVIEVPLQASDADGDPIRFAINGTTPTPTMTLSTDGLLTIQPTPTQLGTYNFVVQASDGSLSDDETITVRVNPDPIGTTRVSGRVLNVDGTPIVGVRVEVGTVSGLTDASGTFLLNLGAGIPAAETLRIRGELLTGASKYPFIAEKLPFMLQHEIYAGYNNRIVRPIYLPTLNVGTPINPTADMTVERQLSQNEAPAEVVVRANTLFNQQGVAFSGSLSITEVPPERTPAALPPGLRTDLVVTIQPGEMNFASPAPLSLPNRSNLPPGTPMDLWSINPVTGEFENVGGAIVSQDGRTVKTVSGGIRNSSWHFFSPEADLNVDYSRNPRNQKDDKRKCPCARAGLSSEVELSSGALIETHNLVSYQSMGADRSLAWVYDSKRADPRPIVHVGYANVRPAADRLLMASLELKRNDTTVRADGHVPDTANRFGLRGGENFWKVPNEGGNINGAIQVDMSTMPTGVYEVRIQQGLMNIANGRIVGTTSDDVDRLVHVNGIGSPFGNGWGLAGLQQLVIEGNGDVLLIDGDGGDGNQLLYTRNDDGTYTSTAGDFTVLSKQMDGRFLRRDPNGNISEYSSVGDLTSVRDRVGNMTRYEYSTDSSRRLLAWIDPVGLRTTFSYTNGRVSAVTDPANRLTTFEYDSKGNLIRLTDPDGSARNWEYDSGNRMVGEVDKRGARESSIYHFSGRAVGAIRKDGSRIDVQPLQLQGLYPPERTASPINAPDAYRALSVESNYFDANGNWSKTTLDERGQELSSRDSIGQQTQSIRDASNLITSMIDGRGHVTFFKYDDRGNLVSQRDEVSSSSQMVEAVLSNPGEVDEYVYTTSPGQRLVVDTIDSTENSARIAVAGRFSRSDSPGTPGDVLGTIDGNDLGVLSFPTGGELRIRVSAILTATGPTNYRFRLLDLTSSIPIESGTWVEGKSVAAGDLSLYQFQGRRGQAIVGQWGSDPSQQNSWTILGPSLSNFGSQGSLINSTVSQSIALTLPSDGVYYALVRSRSVDSPFRFRIVAPTITTSSLTISTPTTVALERFGDYAEYRFTSALGKAYLLDRFAFASDVEWKLVEPSGSEISLLGYFGDNATFVTSQSGIYRLVVTSKSETPKTASFRLLDFGVSRVLPLGADTLATVSNPEETSLFQFNATEGSRFAIEDRSLMSGAFPGSFAVYDSRGMQLPLEFMGLGTGWTVKIPMTGTFFLATTSVSASVASNVRFRASFATTETFDVTSITLAGEISRFANRHEYRFNATSGTAIYVDDLPSQFRVEVLDPAGNSVESPSKIRLLNETGSYRLRITRIDPLGTNSYSLRLLSPSNLSASPLNTPISGTASRTQPAIARWNATSGMHLQYTLSNSVGVSAQWISPFGNRANNDSILATAAGNYYLLVYGATAQPQSFTVTASDIAGGTVVSSGLNRILTGTLEPQQFDDYPIRVSAGMRLAINNRDRLSNVSVSFVDSNNEDIPVVRHAYGDMFFVDVPSSAPMRLRVTNKRSEAQSYSLYLQDIATAEQLPLETYIQGTLANSETRLWRVQLQAGQRISLDQDTSIGGAGTVDLRIINPDGNTLNAVDKSFASIAVTGEYFVLAQPNIDGAPIAFRIIDRGSVPRLQLEQSVVANSSRPVQTLVYSFESSGAQRFSLDQLSNSTTNLSWLVRDPSGRVLNFNGIGSFDFETLISGTHSIEIRFQGTAPSSVEFRLSQARITNKSLSFGITESLTFDRKGDTFVYALNLQAGEQILVDSSNWSNVIPTWTRPDGGDATEFQARASKQLTTVLSSGPYTLTLKPSYFQNGQSSSVAFRLLKGNLSNNVQIGNNVPFVLNPGTETKLFRFPGTAGQRISFARVENANSLTVSLYSAFSVLQTSGWQDFEATLPLSGDYILAISGLTENRIESQFRITLATESTVPAPLNTPISGRVNEVGDIANHTFNGRTGQAIVLWKELSAQHNWQLFAPSGREASSFASDFDRQSFLLEETGQYRMVVRRSSISGASPDYRFRLIDLNASTPVVLGQEFSAAFQSANEQFVFAIFADRDAKYEVKTVSGSSDNVNFVWVDSTLRAINEPRNADGAYRTTNSEGGTAWLLVQATGAVNTNLRLVVTRNTVEDRAFAFGQSISGTLASIATSHRYRVPVLAKDSVFFEVASSTNASVTLEGETNPFFFLGGSVVSAASSRVYSILLEHPSPSTTSDPSTYDLKVTKLSELPVSGIGSTLSATVGLNTTAGLARLQVPQDQRVRFRSLNGQSQATIILYDPSGNTLNLVDDTFLVAGGTDYWVAFRSGFTDSVSVSYVVEAVSETPVTESGLDNVRAYNIPVSGKQSFEFVARTGTTVLLDFPQDLRNGTTSSVTGPDGITLSTSTSIIIRQGGRYIVELTNIRTDVLSGSLAFRNMASIPLVQAGTWFNIDTTLATGNQYVRMSAGRESFLWFDSESLESSTNLLSAKVLPKYAENETTVFGSFVLKNGGELIVRYSLAGITTPTRARVLDLAQSPAIELGSLNVERIGPNQYAARTYRIDGQAGMRLRFTNSTEARNFGTESTLYDSKGFPLVSSVAHRSWETTLPATATYWMVIDGYIPSSEDYRFTLFLGNTTATDLKISASGNAGNAQSFTYDDQFSVLTGSVDEIGRRMQYTLDPSNGNVLETIERGPVDDPTPTRITRYSYNALGLVTSVTDPLGRISQYEYDSLGRKTRETIAKGTPQEASTRWEYDSAGNVTAVIDALNRRTEYTYDALNRVKTFKAPDPDGAGPALPPVTQLDYDNQGNVIRFIDPLNRSTEFAYDSFDREVRSTDADRKSTLTEYDRFGNIVAVVDALGRRNTFRYDSRNRLIQMTDPLGNSTKRRYDDKDQVIEMEDELGRITKFDYDARGRVVRTTDPNGSITKVTYDAADQIIESLDELKRKTLFSYNVFGELTAATDSLGAVARFEYDQVGNQTKIYDGENNPTSFVYDAQNRLTEVMDALGGRRMVAYDLVGNVIRTEDELRRQTSMEYDALDRPIRRTDALNGVWTRQYDAVGNITAFTDARNNRTTYLYDALDRLIATTDANSGVARIAYDALGNVISMTDEEGRVETYKYDALNRLLEIQDALQNKDSFVYDPVGNRIAQIDGLSKTTNFTYDRLDRITKIVDPRQGETIFEYDAVGNRTSLTDPVRNKTTFDYDARNRLLRETNPLGKSLVWTYDLVGNNTEFIDRNGRIRRNQFDELNRQTTETWLNSTGQSVRDITWTYDAASQLLTARDLDSQFTYTYDALGRIKTTDNQGTPVSPRVQFSYDYDANGNQTQRLDRIAGANAGGIDRTFDRLDRIDSIRQNSGGAVNRRVDLEYDKSGLFKSLTRFRDAAGQQQVAKSTYTYDAAARLQQIRHAKIDQVLANYDFSWDAADRITRIVSPDGTANYSYDVTDQLTGADHSAQTDENYAYDLNGNRTMSGYRTGANNRLESDGKYNYSYDDNGNRILRVEIATGERTEYGWDHRNRMTSVLRKNSSGAVLSEVRYTYDVFDRRMRKSIDSDGAGPGAATIKQYVHDGDHVAYEFDGNGQLTHRYLHGPVIDMVLAHETGSGDVHWMLADHLGTVRDIIDSAGVIINRIQYDSFGRILSQSNSALTPTFAYTGREWDPETGLFQYRARYYDPLVGRFVSEDPIRFKSGSWNIVSYVDQNPVVRTDPRGLTRYTVGENGVYPEGEPGDTSAPAGGDASDAWLAHRPQGPSQLQKDLEQFKSTVDVSTTAIKKAYDEVASPAPSPIGKAFSYLGNLVRFLQNLASIKAAKNCEEYAMAINIMLKDAFVDKALQYGAALGAAQGLRAGVAIGGPEGAPFGAVIGGGLGATILYHLAAKAYDDQIAPFVLESSRNEWERTHPKDECGCKHQSTSTVTKYRQPKQSNAKPQGNAHPSSPPWMNIAGGDTSTGPTSIDRTNY